MAGYQKFMLSLDNNQRTLIPFHKLKPPYFKDYSDPSLIMSLTNWPVTQNRVRDGNRQWRTFGKPTFTITLPYLKDCEYYYIRNTILGGLISTKMVMHHWHQETNDWKDMRLTMTLTAASQNGAAWEGIELTCEDVTVLL